MKRKFNLNLGCIIKVLVLIALIMGILFIVLQCSGGSCIRKIDKTLPDISEAPWMITTPTHLYYAKEAVKSGLGVSMSFWYEKLKGKWIYHSDTIILPYKLYGDITVERR